MSRRDFGKVEPGGEMLALAGQHDRADVRREPGEEGLEPKHRHVVERVALLRAREPQMGDGAAARRFQGRRQVDADRQVGILLRHGSSCAALFRRNRSRLD